MASYPRFRRFHLGVACFERAECAVVNTVIRGGGSEFTRERRTNVVTELVPDHEFDHKGGHPCVIKNLVDADQAAFFVHGTKPYGTARRRVCTFAPCDADAFGRGVRWKKLGHARKGFLKMDAHALRVRGGKIVVLVEMSRCEVTAQAVKDLMEIGWKAAVQDRCLYGVGKALILSQCPMGAQRVARIIFATDGYADPLIGVYDDAIEKAVRVHSCEAIVDGSCKLDGAIVQYAWAWRRSGPHVLFIDRNMGAAGGQRSL